MKKADIYYMTCVFLAIVIFGWYLMTEYYNFKRDEFVNRCLAESPLEIDRRITCQEKWMTGG